MSEIEDSEAQWEAIFIEAATIHGPVADETSAALERFVEG